MTDNDIVKALEICTTNGASCKDCPAFVKVDRSNCKQTFRGALDLINRQKAKIEELKSRNSNLTSDLTSLQGDLTSAKAEIERLKNHIQEGINLAKEIPEMVSIIKDEAYKEFIEKVRKLAVGLHPCSDEMRIFDSDLDNILNELVGEEG